MKFKAGDRVKFKEDYLNSHLNDDLKRYVGKGLTIIDIFCGIGYYTEDTSGNTRIWCCVDDVLELVEEKNKMRNIDVILKDEKLNCNSMCMACYRLKNGNYCYDGVDCISCEFYKNKNCYKFLAEEYKPKIKLNKFEYDLLRTNDQSHLRKFNSFATYRHMQEVGHFKNVMDTLMTIQDILDNCEIED